jgi:glycosyltransferase involved in cell wall biosynthesis
MLAIGSSRGAEMTPEDPTVSVVVPVFNAERWIERTLSSAIAQTYRNIEIIVVDDGSVDQSAAIAETVASRDERIRLFRRSQSGLSATRNFGIAQARGSLIAPLDADDLWHPEKIARQVAAMRTASPEVSLIYCWAVEIDENDLIIPPIRQRSTFHGKVLTELVAAAGFIDSSSNPLFRRSYLDAVGGYDLTLNRVPAEDFRLYLALAEISEFAVVPSHLVGYRRVINSMSRSVAEMERGLDVSFRRIMERWPDMPADVKSQHIYHRNEFLAHLSLTKSQSSQALRYLIKGYGARPSALFSSEIFTFAARLLARSLGVRRGAWSSRAKQIAFKDFQPGS